MNVHFILQTQQKLMAKNDSYLEVHLHGIHLPIGFIFFCNFVMLQLNTLKFTCSDYFQVHCN